MIRREDIVVVELDQEQLDECRQRAKKAEIGGRSRIYDDHKERMGHLGEDQFLGQVGQMCLSIHLTGDVLSYREARDKADANPTEGDGGHDLVGIRMDIKCSRMRKSGRRMGEYYLVVPPREHHPGFTYILALVSFEGNHEDLTKLKVNLIGYNNAGDLKLDENWLGHGPKYAKKAKELWQLSMLKPPKWLDEDEELMASLGDDTEAALAGTPAQSTFSFIEDMPDPRILEGKGNPKVRGLLG